MLKGGVFMIYNILDKVNPYHHRYKNGELQATTNDISENTRYCTRCNSPILADGLCVTCGKEYPCEPDILDDSPNAKERQRIKEIIDVNHLIDKLDEQFEEAIYDAEKAEGNLSKAKEKPVFVDPKLEYPQIYPRVKCSMLFDIWDIPKWGSQNPLWGISLLGLSAISLIIALLAGEFQGIIAVVIMFVAWPSVLIFGAAGLVLFILEMFNYLSGITRWQKADLQVRKQAEINRIVNSQEYKVSCKKIYDQYIKNYEQAKQKYERELEEQPTKIADAEADLKSKQNTADYTAWLYFSALDYRKALLDKYKLLPESYRANDVVEKIYEIMNSSIYDTKTAIEMYDRQKDHYLKQAQIEETQRYNELQEQANQIGYANWEAQMEANNIADRARRERNIADAIKIYQNHRK